MHLLVSIHQSYLNYPRINFAGSIKADVSTVNNHIRNWNASVDPLLRPPEPSWNPKGTGIWRIQNARVTASCDLGRTCKNTSDRIIHANVKGVFLSFHSMSFLCFSYLQTVVTEKVF